MQLPAHGILLAMQKTPPMKKPSANPGPPRVSPPEQSQKAGGEEKTKLVEKVVAQLSRDILVGVYAPGERIREPEVSARIGVSRAPVREALRILEHEGMIEVTPWRGARVINPSPDEIADLFDLLAALEGVIATLAARHASDADLSRYALKIEEAAQTAKRIKQDRKKDFFQVIGLAYEAGEVLAASCGSPMAANMIRRVGKPAYWLHRFLMPAPPRWIEQSLAKQFALRAALLARDEDRCERAARALVVHTKRLVVLRAQEVAAAQGILHRGPAWNVQQIAAGRKRKTAR